MIKNLFFSFVFVTSVLSISAQKEVYFNSTPKDSIKVESMHGFELNWTIDPISILQSSNGFNSFALPIYVGYFNEKRIASNWTLKSTIGFYNVFSKSPVYQKDSLTGYYYYSSLNNEYRNIYSLRVQIGIDPRWYWEFKQRYQNGTANLNTGWFLSFPFALRTTLLQTPDPIYNSGWIPNYFNVNASLTPTIGYRQAIFKQLFLEGSFGIGLNTNIYKYYNNQISLSTIQIYPQFNLKAAYTFK